MLLWLQKLWLTFRGVSECRADRNEPSEDTPLSQETAADLRKLTAPHVLELPLSFSQAGKAPGAPGAVCLWDEGARPSSAVTLLRSPA